ncbi:MAG TPA: hypothetical protein VFT62_02080 [Mycobacteriales bacterium]|nr:hypothetical protein [Mycobacteriales bacterium]
MSTDADPLMSGLGRRTANFAARRSGAPTVGGKLSSGGVLLAWCLLAIADASHAGYYSSAAVSCLLAGFVVLVAAVALGRPLARPDRALLAAPAVLVVVEAVVNPTHPFLYLHGTDLHIVSALGVATAVAAAASLLAPHRWQRACWLSLVALAIATGVVTVVLIRDPGIDVWDLLQQSSSGLLHGDDMYRQHWSGSTGLQAVYPYLPGSTLLLAPFRWLVGDVRFGLLTAAVLAAVVVRRMEHRAAPAVSALLLGLPGWVLLINRSWTEPLLLAALAIVVLALLDERPAVAVIALAVALACKQHIVLLLPVFAIWPSFGLRRTAVSLAAAAAVVLPWFAAGPGDLWHDAVHANLALQLEPRALNLPSLLLRYDLHVGFWLAAAFLAGAYGLVLWRVPRTPSGLALACAIVLWAFDLANKQTFFNHYTLPLGLLAVAVASAERPVLAASVSSRPLLPAPHG